MAGVERSVKRAVPIFDPTRTATGRFSPGSWPPVRMRRHGARFCERFIPKTSRRKPPNSKSKVSDPIDSHVVDLRAPISADEPLVWLLPVTLLWSMVFLVML
jgi:hypothetical protein